MDEIIVWGLAMAAIAAVIARYAAVSLAEAAKQIRMKSLDVRMREAEVMLQEANNGYLLPNRDGALPVPRALLDDQEAWRALLALASQAVDARRLPAPVPHSITIAPHYISKGDGKALTVVEPEQIEAAPIIQPRDFFQLYQAGELPSNELLLGLDMDAGYAPFSVGWEQLYSCLIGGLSTMGKSTLIRSLLAQSALQGGRFVVLDPHFASGDRSLGASLAPLRNQMLRDVAHDEKTMIQALKFVYEVGERRLKGKDKDRSPLVLIVDETTALLRRSAIAEQLLKVLERIAQETAKVSVFAMCIGQNFSAEVMPTTTRNSFISMISCKARRQVARIQADNLDFGRMAQTLERGQIVFMPPTGELRRIAVPNTTAEHLAHVGAVLNATKNASGVWVPAPGNHAENHKLLADAEPSNDDLGTMPEPSTEPLIFGEKEQRALVMFYSGKEFSEIIPAVWGIVDRGRKYQEASKLLQAIIRADRNGGN